MTDQGVTLRVDDAQVRDAVEAAVALGADPSEITRRISDYLKQSTDERFETETDPSGVRWTALRPRTIAARRRKGHIPISILTETGVMRSQNVPFFDNTVAGVGTNNVYARIHQLGGTIDVEARTQTIYQRYDAKTAELQPRFVRKRRSNFARDVAVGAHEITIPAREFLGFSDADRARCIAIAAEVMDESMGVS